MPTLRRRLPAAVGGLGLVVLVTAVVALPSVRDDEGERATSGAVAFGDLQVGDCLGALDYGAQATTVDVAPCNEPHTAQVFAAFDLVGQPYPSDADLRRDADAGCTQRLLELQGIPDVDLYDVVTVTPTEGSWTDGDRLVQCLLVKKGGDPVTGSLLEDDAP